MNHCVKAGSRSGIVSIPSSKSYAHRNLICAALSRNKSTLIINALSKDITATIRCLNALGAEIKAEEKNRINVSPVKNTADKTVHLFCGESGSTLRFLLPVVGALGADAVFHMEGKLPQRPIDALADELISHGMNITQKGDELYCSGKLSAGEYHITGSVSSQYISGLLFALPLLDGDSTLCIEGKIESADYITMTEDAILSSGIELKKDGNLYFIKGNQKYDVPKTLTVEQDWSGAAFFLCMGAISEKGISIKEMPMYSKQGDKEIINILKRFGAKIALSGNEISVSKGELIGQTVDAAAIPDLIPAISALAAGAQGTTRIINAERLRYKESDRLKATTEMLKALGADIEETQDGLIINGKSQLDGGQIDPFNDHRIAMSAAVAAGICKNDVTVINPECVEKSFPDFWYDIETLEVCL